jgi:hypothetical protein
MNTIEFRLRAWASHLKPTPHRARLVEAADEIARLEKLRLCPVCEIPNLPPQYVHPDCALRATEGHP